MIKTYYFDTETCGLHGVPVLLQYAIDDGEIILYDLWSHPIEETLKLFEDMANSNIIGFNLAFDWFHINKFYNMLAMYPDYDAYPEDIISDLVEIEPKARDGLCLKPNSAFDVMLHARKGPYQSTMDRDDIRIKRVPTVLAWQLAKELDQRIPLKDIYFAKKKDKERWKVFDIDVGDGEISRNFKDIVLKFAPSSALKALAVDALALNQDDVLLFSDVDESIRKFYPEEVGYAPFAKALPNSDKTWPYVIKYFLSHWYYNSIARKYAKDDVDYTRRLYKFFGSPPIGDDDSELACMVGAVRWKGFKVDLQKMLALRNKVEKRKYFEDGTKVPTDHRPVRRFIEEKLSEEERLVIKKSTKKVILEEISKFETDCPACSDVADDEIAKSCKECGGTRAVKHPAAERAKQVLLARQAAYDVNIYDKFFQAGRFHASFKIIGALSSRMSGGDDLNAQGIKSAKEVRGCFPLAFDNMILCGGDFEGFEVTLAEAVYNDPGLRQALLSGKKIHALFGVHVYPHMTYEEICEDKEIYKRCKSAVFAMLYGGTAETLKDRLGVPLEVAELALKKFHKQFPGVAKAQISVERAFCSMSQPGGLGTKVIWRDPEEYIETLFGFRRYFTLENQICKVLFELANNPPKEWKSLSKDIRLCRDVRRGRIQTAQGALQSALYGSAFAIQAGSTRAAKNHVIQGSGAQVTKKVQRNIWDLQPKGVNEWIVCPMNVHDEIMCPTKPGYEDRVKTIVDSTVESIRPKVPLIKMDWVKGIKSWAEK